MAVSDFSRAAIQYELWLFTYESLFSARPWPSILRYALHPGYYLTLYIHLLETVLQTECDCRVAGHTHRGLEQTAKREYDTPSETSNGLGRVQETTLPERIHDQPTDQLWIKVGGFLGHAIICLGYLANLPYPCCIQQESSLSLT